MTNLLEKLQFKIDTDSGLFGAPTFDYQPIPWVGVHNAEIRGEATKERWLAIKGDMKNIKTLKDIGCCVGYFCLSAADEFGIHSLGMDLNDRFLRIANFAKKKLKEPNKASFLNIHLDKNNISLMPQTDATIFFSVWHHWVYYYGLETATEMLQVLWNSTNKVMYFESGEEETKEEFNLPFNKEAKMWLEEYLKASLPNAKVERVGDFLAGSYEHYKLKNIKRTVFKVSKI